MSATTIVSWCGEPYIISSQCLRVETMGGQIEVILLVGLDGGGLIYLDKRIVGKLDWASVPNNYEWEASDEI